MKKTFITIVAMLCAISTFADGTPGLIVHKTDGSSISISTSALRNIKFSDGAMVVNMKDNSQQTISVDDISDMTFGSISSAITFITEGKKEEQIVITDLAGRVIYRGNANECGQLGTLDGIYVITINGVSHKVRINRGASSVK